MPLILNPIVLDKKIEKARDNNKHGGCTKLFWKHWKDNKDRFDNMLDETDILGSMISIHEIARTEIGTKNVPLTSWITHWIRTREKNGWKQYGLPLFWQPYEV